MIDLSHMSPDLMTLSLLRCHTLFVEDVSHPCHKVVDEAVDPTYGVSSVTELASRQSQLIQHFQSRRRKEYLERVSSLDRWW